MTLELMIKEYYVSEFISKEIHDTPIMGVSQTSFITKNEYGPYHSEIDAKRKIALLTVDRKEEGWCEARQGGLYKGDYDLNYSIKVSNRPF